MTPEVLRFLQQFAEPIELGLAAKAATDHCLHPTAPQWAIDAVRGGLLELGWKDNGERDTDPVIDSKRIYSRKFLLTDKGLSACGLPPRVSPVAKPKSRTLFDLE